MSEAEPPAQRTTLQLILHGAGPPRSELEKAVMRIEDLLDRIEAAMRAARRPTPTTDGTP